MRLLLPRLSAIRMMAARGGKFFHPNSSRDLPAANEIRCDRWGYVEFKSLDDSSSAIENMNNSPFMGRRLSVQFVQRTNLRLQGNEPSEVLFLGNLPFQLTDQDLNELFKNIRGCIDVRVAMDRRTGQPRGFAHADFKDVDSAIKAKAQLEGTQVYGRYIRVDYSEHANRTPAEGANTPAARTPVPRGLADGEEPSAVDAAVADEAEAAQTFPTVEETQAGENVAPGETPEEAANKQNTTQ